MAYPIKKEMRRRSSRAQSAMEYLLTYGWSILVLMIVLATLYALGVFNFGAEAGSGSCVGLQGFGCMGGNMNSAGVLSFTVSHTGGGAAVRSLVISAVGCSNSSAQPTTWSSAVTLSPLPSSNNETLLAQCNLAGSKSIGTTFKGTVWVQYLTGGGTTLTQEVGIVNYAVSSSV